MSAAVCVYIYDSIHINICMCIYTCVYIFLTVKAKFYLLFIFYFLYRMHDLLWHCHRMFTVPIKLLKLKLREIERECYCCHY